MAERRVDRIRQILESKGGRARVRDVLDLLRQTESNDAITNSAVWIAINSENNRLDELGERPLFRTSRSGEEWGWIRLETDTAFEPGTAAEDLESMIRDKNRKIDVDLLKRLESMDWRVFESTFLAEVLEKLGFQEVVVTQATRDGGADARVTYKRGIVEAKAIVSAKRWASKSSVSVEEVRMLRGIKGEEDTAIIVTTGRFTSSAEREARPGQNQRVVYLIDGKRLVEICKRHEIGVRKVSLPDLVVLDEELFPDTEEGVPGRTVENPLGPTLTNSNDAVSPKVSLTRFRDSMLAELRKEDIASLTGLALGTVRSYLSVPSRRRELAKRIRADDNLRKAALNLVEEARR